MDRNAIIRRAVVDKLGNGVEMFTAAEILAVAQIDEQALAKIVESLEGEVKKHTK